jgi:carbamoyltransferase
MKVLGLTLGKTVAGKPLKDGSLSWYTSDNSILIISEEQAADRKHAGGYEASLQKLYETTSSRPDLVAVSSCCEPMITDVSGFEGQFGCEIRVVNHHLSHAHQAAWSAGYRDALIVVLDAGGNTLEPFDDRGTDWWRYEREQASIFECVDGRIKLIDRIFSKPFEIGIGEFWRYMTYACGFDSSNKASKVMELAAFSEDAICPIPELFFSSSLSSTMLNDPPSKLLLRDKLLGFFEPSFRLEEVQTALAGWAQKSLEAEVLRIVNSYQKQLGHSILCLSGGVALNCKLVQSIRERGPFDDIVVGYAPSDKGQSLGNCLAVQEGRKKVGSLNGLDPFRGSKRVASVSDIRSLLGEDQLTHIVEPSVPPQKVKDLIANGFLIGTWRGRGEIGARALGNSSILADPAVPGIKERLNQIKGRPEHTPVAPAFSKEYFEECFGPVKANYFHMSETVTVPRTAMSLPSSLQHVDRTVRPQIIDEKRPSYLSKLVASCNAEQRKEFVVLNTSFNGAGRPMAGTLSQAVSEFRNLGLDGLSCAKDVLVRKKNARLEARLDASDAQKAHFANFQDFERRKSEFGLTQEVELRERFLLFDNYIRWAADGRKVTTIRFKEGLLSVAGVGRLPLVETKNFKQSAMDVQKLEVDVLGFTVKKFQDLDQVDAQRDGFEKTSHLKQTLRNIYPKMKDSDYVTINFIRIVTE